MTEPLTLAQRLNGRDIYECANQLEGYVDTSTPERLAQFLLREGKAASDLADEVHRLREDNKALEAERDVARHHTSNLLARIHRDGGHYESEHGTSTAAEDADSIVSSLFADRDAAGAKLAKVEAELARQIDLRNDQCRRKLDAWADRARLTAQMKVLEERGQAFANQVRHITCKLNGQAYSSTVSALNHFDAALASLDTVSDPVGGSDMRQDQESGFWNEYVEAASYVAAEVQRPRIW